MKVILRPINKDAWSGMVRYKSCHLTIGTYYTRSGALYTGLSEDEAREMERKMGYPEGHLSPNSPFWETYTIKSIGDSELNLDTEIPSDELKYLFCRNHKRVKNGLDDNSKNGAEYVLVNVEGEAEEQNRINRIKRDALTYIGKMSPKDMRQALRIFGFASDDMSNEVCENTLFDYVEKNARKFTDRWVDNKNKLLEYLVSQAISKGVLRKNKNIYKYGTEIIGHSFEDTLDFLLDPKNQDVRIAIEQETDAKYKAKV
jgi:hypothetical protein